MNSWSKPMHDHHSDPHAQFGNVGEATHLEKDPVCGIDVDPGSAKHSDACGGHTYYFCSQGCKTKRNYALDKVAQGCYFKGSKLMDKCNVDPESSFRSFRR